MRPVEAAPLLPNPPASAGPYLHSLVSRLGGHLAQLGHALNDELLVRSDWIVTVGSAATPHQIEPTTRNLLWAPTVAAVATLPAILDTEPHYYGVFNASLSAQNITVGVQTGERLNWIVNGTTTVVPGTGQIFMADKAVGWWMLSTT